MSVLFVSTNDHVPWGGSEVLWSRAAKKLAARGTAVSASLWKWEPEHPAVADLRSAGVHVHGRFRAPYEASRGSKAWAMFRRGFVPTHRDNRFEALSLFHPGRVVFSVGDHLDPTFIRFSEELRRLHVPYDVIVQLVHPYAVVKDVFADRAIAAYAGAVHTVFVSRQNLDIARSHLGHAFPNATIVPNPVDLGPGAEALPPPAQRDLFRLAMVASLVPFHKGQDIILDVLAQPKWKERPLHLDLYGEGHGRRVVERLLGLYGLERVTLHGFQHDRKEIWSNAHAALFASRMEGLSLALLEAMAYGRMVITTDVGGARERIDHGHTGFIAAHADARALDITLEEAWSARDRWAAMGVAARAAYEAHTPMDPVDRLIDALGL